MVIRSPGDISRARVGRDDGFGEDDVMHKECHPGGREHGTVPNVDFQWAGGVRSIAVPASKRRGGAKERDREE